MPFQILFKYSYLYTMVVLAWFLTSCKPTKKEIPKQENTSINFNKIDLYPVLPECKKIAPRLQKNCFYTAISKRIKQNLGVNNLQFKTPFKDSVSVLFVIDTIGKSKLISITHQSEIYKDTLDFFIKKSFKSLPRMQPAVKMGIPVSAQFAVPIVITSKTD